MYHTSKCLSSTTHTQTHWSASEGKNILMQNRMQIHKQLCGTVCVCFFEGPKHQGPAYREVIVSLHTHTHPSECAPRCYATHETGWICKNTCCRAWTTTARFTLILHSHTHYKCEMVWRIGLSNICTVTRSAVWRFTSVSSALMHRVKSITIIITIISTSPRL